MKNYYADELENLAEMDKLLNSHELPSRLNEEGIDILNMLVGMKEIEAIIVSLSSWEVHN